MGAKEPGQSEIFALEGKNVLNTPYRSTPGKKYNTQHQHTPFLGTNFGDELLRKWGAKKTTKMAGVKGKKISFQSFP